MFISITDNVNLELIQYPGINEKKLLINAPPYSTCLIQLLNINASPIETLFNDILVNKKTGIIFDSQKLNKSVYLLKALINRKVFSKKIVVP